MDTIVCITDLDKLNFSKLVYSGLILGLSQFLLLPQLPHLLKSGQRWLKNNYRALLV